MKKLLPILLLTTMLSGCGFEIVDTGHRGILTRFGKVEGPALEEGLHFYNPFTSDIVELDVRIQKWEATTAAYTKDAQQVEITYTLNFFPDKTKMSMFYEQVGADYADKLIPQIVNGKLKEVVGKYEAVELISKRQGAVTAMEDLIKSELATKDIEVTKFEVPNFDFNNEFEQAVEAKVIAIQRAEQAKNKTVQIEEEAKQKLIAAKAEAESMRIRAQALTQNKSLVDYEAIQKWDGKLPTITMGGNSVPFIQLPAGK